MKDKYMIKRHGLVIFLFCISALVGITIVVLETVTAFFFSMGILVLPGVAVVFFAAAILWWQAQKKKIRTRDPERSVRYQGRAFGTWFAAHNLFWTLIGSVSIWGVFKFFGYKPWVVLFSAGALACACFAFLGIFFIPQRKMLGLCWQSPIPDGLEGFWARAGAAVVLRDRYEYAAEHDQKKSSPLLWSISRVFERSTSGGADRGIDLMETRPGFLSTRLKKEGLHRLKVLSVLFWITVVLAALPGLLGIVPHYWDRFPGNWPSDNIKKSDPGKSPMMAKSQPDQSSRENQTRDKDQKPGQDQQTPSNPENKQDKPGESGQSKQTSGASDQTPGTSGQDKSSRGQDSKESGELSNSNREKDSKENSKEIGDRNEKEGSGQGTASSRPGGTSREQDRKADGERSEKESRGQGPGDTQTGGSNREQNSKDQRGEGKAGQPSKDSGKGEKDGSQSGGTGQDKSKAGPSKTAQEGKGSEGKGKEPGQGQGKEQGGSDTRVGGTGQGQKGEGETGQSGAGQNQESKSGQGKGKAGSDSEGKGKSEGESQGGGKTSDTQAGRTGPGQKDEGKPGKGGTGQDQGSKSQVKGKTESDSKGKGEGQGLGSADAIPGMKDEPEPLPQIPSRATKMVDLELPTLTETPTKGKESGDASKENTPGQVPVPKGKAPTEQFKTGEQERSASKPEQYLPNWILNIIKKSHGRAAPAA